MSIRIKHICWFVSILYLFLIRNVNGKWESQFLNKMNSRIVLCKRDLIEAPDICEKTSGEIVGACRIS